MKFQYLEERVLHYSDVFLKGLLTDVMGLFSWSEMLFYLWSTELVVLHWLLLDFILSSVPQKKGDFKGVLVGGEKACFRIHLIITQEYVYTALPVQSFVVSVEEDHSCKHSSIHNQIIAVLNYI